MSEIKDKGYDKVEDGVVLKDYDGADKGLINALRAVVNAINTENIKSGFAFTIDFEVKIRPKVIVKAGEGREGIEMAEVIVFNFFILDTALDEEKLILFSCEHEIEGKEKFFKSNAIDKVIKTFFKECIAVFTTIAKHHILNQISINVKNDIDLDNAKRSHLS
jgi:hypothetical protein